MPFGVKKTHCRGRTLAKRGWFRKTLVKNASSFFLVFWRDFLGWRWDFFRNKKFSNFQSPRWTIPKKIQEWIWISKSCRVWAGRSTAADWTTGMMYNFIRLWSYVRSMSLPRLVVIFVTDVCLSFALSSAGTLSSSNRQFTRSCSGSFSRVLIWGCSSCTMSSC